MALCVGVDHLGVQAVLVSCMQENLGSDQSLAIAVICVTKSRTGNYDFRTCARAQGFPGSTVFGRTHTLRRVCRAITR